MTAPALKPLTTPLEEFFSRAYFVIVLSGLESEPNGHTMHRPNNSSRLLNVLGRSCLLPYYRRKLRHFEYSLQHARHEQDSVRTRILNYGTETAFGRDFKFTQIQTREDFRRQIPIAEFDEFAPYIDRVAAGETTALFPPGESLLTFVETSATSGHAKILPVTQTWFRHYARD